MSMIKSQVIQYEHLNRIIKTKETELRSLRKQRVELMNSIQDYLINTNQPGLKYGNVAIYKEEKVKRYVTKKIEEKEDTGVDILRKHGIGNARDVMKEVLQAMKGPEIKCTKVIIEPIDKYKKKQKKKIDKK